MKIYLWKNFSKRKNSTLRPLAAQRIEKDVYLKENTSVESPSFILSGVDFDFNYCQAFGHYYYVSDIIAINSDQIQIDCKQDLLATYRTEITASFQFVERDSVGYNVMLPDPLVVMQNSESVYENVTSLANLFNSSGMYVISVLNNIGSGAGFTTYYLTTAAEIEKLAQYCNQNLADSISGGTIVDWLQATFLKTADAIIDCKWLPISPTSVVGVAGLHNETMRIGKDDVTGVSGYRFTDSVIISKTYTLTPSYNYTDFRLGEPYTKAFLFIPFYGIYKFNAIDFPSTINVRFDLDIATGDMTVYLISGTKLISTINYNVAVNSPVGKVGNEAGSVITSTLGTAGGVIKAFASESAAGVAAAGLTAAASAINGISAAMSISPSIKGSMAGRSMSKNGLDLHTIIITIGTTNPVTFTPVMGRPVMQYKSLSGVTGYVKCNNASVYMPGKDGDREEVNSFLNTGIFIE